ncbi:MAG: NnrS family protein [Alphaproteobacteria bacterium]|nr:NnrS family protein [Alphaproteobacteria bacterium]
MMNNKSKLNLWDGHLFSEALRFLFPFIALYAIFAIVIWTLTFTGVVDFNPAGNIIAWHYYDMLYGFTFAALLGFILTAAPEWSDTAKISGRELFLIALAWMFCRLSFWFLEYISIYPAVISHLGLNFWLIWRVFPLLKNTMMKRLFWTILAQFLAQILFFTCYFELLDISLISVSRLASGIFVIMILQVLKPISMVIMNDSLERKNIDETFIPRPPRRRFAIFCILLFIISDFAIGNDMLVVSDELHAYISFAATAAILNILNDWHIKNAIFSSFAMPLYLIYWFMAIGFLIFGLDKLAIFDYLSDVNALLHARHLIFMGSISLAIFMVLLIAGRRHTGRSLNLPVKAKIALLSLIASVLSRGFLPIIYPNHVDLAYQLSATFWVLSFGLYLVEFSPYFWAKNQE